MWPFSKKQDEAETEPDVAQPEVLIIAELIDANEALFSFCNSYNKDNGALTDSVFIADATGTISILVQSDGICEVRGPLAFDINDADCDVLFDAAKRLAMKKIAAAIAGVGAMRTSTADMVEARAAAKATPAKKGSRK